MFPGRGGLTGEFRAALHGLCNAILTMTLKGRWIRRNAGDVFEGRLVSVPTAIEYDNIELELDDQQIILNHNGKDYTERSIQQLTKYYWNKRSMSKKKKLKRTKGRRPRDDVDAERVLAEIQLARQTAKHPSLPKANYDALDANDDLDVEDLDEEESGDDNVQGSLIDRWMRNFKAKNMAIGVPAQKLQRKSFRDSMVQHWKSTRMMTAVHLIREHLLTKPGKVLVFDDLIAALDVLAAGLDTMQLAYLRHDGHESTKQREANQKHF